MDKLFILTMVEEFFEEEFKSLNEGLDKYDWMKADPLRFILQTMAEMCGIVMFIQKLGVDFDSVNNIYEKYYDELWEMRRKAYDLKNWKK